MQKFFKILKLFLVALILNLNLNFAFGADLDFNFDLEKMREENPDFTTFPDYNGIIWRKQSVFTKNKDNGFEKTHLYIILGRNGIDYKWLNWNIPVPERGSAEVLRSELFSLRTGRKIKDVQPVFMADRNIIQVEFFGENELNDAMNFNLNNLNNNNENFIIIIMWREVKNNAAQDNVPDLRSFEDIYFFQEDIPVWDSIAEIKFSFAPRPEFKTFPKNIEPDIKNDTSGAVYTWRRVNLSPYDKYKDMIVSEREGLAFGMRRGDAGLAALIREVNGTKVPNAPAQLNLNDVNGVLSWLYNQPEIILSGTSRREIPDKAPWTRNEKILLAYNWLKDLKSGVKAKSLLWQMPIEITPEIPVCAGILGDAILELSAKKSPNATGFFYDMSCVPIENTTPPLLRGHKIIGADDNGSLLKRKIPDGKSASNLIEASMNLNLDTHGILSGKVNVALKGAWPEFLLNDYKINNNKNIELEKLVLKLFPGLQAQNFSGVELKNIKNKNKNKNQNDYFELSFNLDKKNGVAGTNGERILAMPPEFAPEFLRSMRDGILPFEILFPFVMQQNINITTPKNTERILSSNKVNKYPDKINYGEDNAAKRNKFTSNARLEVNAYRINDDNAGTLRRSIELWRNFSVRQIPVQIKAGAK